MLLSDQKKNFGIIKLFILSLAGFVIGRLFFFPGFLDPLVPSHSDLYRYFTIGQQLWLAKSWLTPRPLMILVLHILGALRSPEAMWFILSLSSIAFVAALIFLLQKFGRLKANMISILLYSAAIFALPTSFEIYQLDYGGMLAGILSVAAIYCWLQYRETDLTKALLLSLVLFWFSLEMKPTFGATILLLAFIQLLVQRDKTTLFLLLAVFGISVFVVLKDRFLGSPFLGMGYGSEIYAVQISPRKNLHALRVYLTAVSTKELIPGLLIAYYLFWTAARRSWITVLALLALVVSAIMPMVIIPNRTFQLYAWYCAVLLFIPFLYILQPEIPPQTDAPVSGTRKALIWADLIVTLVALSVSSQLHADTLSWHWRLTNYNRNVITSLGQLKEISTAYNFKSSRGVLISGVGGQYQPYIDKRYIQYVTGLPDNYVFLIRQSERTKYGDWSKYGLGNSVYSDQLDIDSFDYFVIYDKDGSIAWILTLAELQALPEWSRLAALACSLNPNQVNWTADHLENVATCLDEAGESLALLDLTDHINTVELTPLLHYYRGHAYQILGKYFLARKEYKQALKLDDNDFYRNALKSLP